MTSQHKHDCCSGHNHHAHQPAIAKIPLNLVNKKKASFVLRLRIEQMDCPTEETLIREKLGKMSGIDGLEFNLMARRLTVRHHLGDPAKIVAAISALGMEAVEDQAAGAMTTVFLIENMDCPTEEALIRSHLAQMDQIDQLSFNLMQRKLTVLHRYPGIEVVQAALAEIGMDAVLENAGSAALTTSAPQRHKTRNKWLQLTVAGVAALSAEVAAWVTGSDHSWLIAVPALIAILLSGAGTYKKGWIAIRNANLNINALMSIAVTGALLIGQWPEAAMVMVLFTLAEMLEGLSLDRARNAIQKLMSVAPCTANVLQADGSWVEMPAGQIQTGMRIRVAPGARIPLDGELTHGYSSVNQAAITGESIPVAKSVGDKVFAGTLNETGSFDYRVTSLAGDSTLARIIRAVEEAQASRAPTQGFVDRFAKVYTPVVCLLALLVAIVPPLAFGLPWLAWIYKALVFLVIACPCALVVSTPVSIVSGLAAAAKAGILVKGGVYLEQGRKLKAIALDKTGTITQGRPEVTDVLALTGAEQTALDFAVALAKRSDHPVSGAISKHGQELGIAVSEVTHFSAILGQGVKGQIDGQWYYLGNHSLVEDMALCNDYVEQALRKFEEEGKTAVIICSADAALAIIAVADTVRESSRQAIRELHALGIHTTVLSGDNTLTVQAIARQVGIDEARGNLMPEAKLFAISDQLRQYGQVGMVGDGMNDAPALAKASIGFAMGVAGTDTAIETADVALMDDDLRKIPQFIRLSQRVGAVLKQNIALALSIKLVFFALALMGMASLWMAVFADMGASLLVVFNGLRLLKKAS